MGGTSQRMEEMISAYKILVGKTKWKRPLGRNRRGPASDFIFVLQYVIVVGLRFKWYTLYFCYINISLDIIHCLR
jgi:hypothetical protein